MYVGKSENGDTIILHDMNARNLRAYVVISQDTTFRFKQVFKKSLASPYWDGVSSGYLAMCRLDNGFYVGVYYLGIEHFYTLLDDDLNTVASFGKYPLKEFGEDAKALKQLMSFRGTLTSYKKSVFYAATRFGYMSRYDVSYEGEPKLIWEHNYSEIDYRVSNNSVKFQDQNEYGFSRMIVNDKYIFATFCGVLNRKMFEEKSTYVFIRKHWLFLIMMVCHWAVLSWVPEVMLWHCPVMKNIFISSKSTRNWRLSVYV